MAILGNKTRSWGPIATVVSSNFQSQVTVYCGSREPRYKSRALACNKSKQSRLKFYNTSQLESLTRERCDKSCRTQPCRAKGSAASYALARHQNLVIFSSNPGHIGTHTQGQWRRACIRKQPLESASWNPFSRAPKNLRNLE